MNPEPPLVIYGAGGHGRVVLDMALTGELAVAWVLDDSPENATLYGIPLARPDESHWKRRGHFGMRHETFARRL